MERCEIQHQHAVLHEFEGDVARLRHRCGSRAADNPHYAPLPQEPNSNRHSLDWGSQQVSRELGEKGSSHLVTASSFIG